MLWFEDIEADDRSMEIRSLVVTSDWYCNKRNCGLPNEISMLVKLCCLNRPASGLEERAAPHKGSKGDQTRPSLLKQGQRKQDLNRTVRETFRSNPSSDAILIHLKHSMHEPCSQDRIHIF